MIADLHLSGAISSIASRSRTRSILGENVGSFGGAGSVELYSNLMSFKLMF